MAVTSVQFAVAVHIMTALGFQDGKEVPSAVLAHSVNADASFVRKSLAKLSRAGLVETTRGKAGGSVLARNARKITLLDIYRASEAPPAFVMHTYTADKRCAVSCGIKGCMDGVLQQVQGNVEKALAKITLAQVIQQIGNPTHG
jgi:Rrf2 family protein